MGKYLDEVCGDCLVSTCCTISCQKLQDVLKMLLIIIEDDLNIEIEWDEFILQGIKSGNLTKWFYEFVKLGGEIEIKNFIRNLNDFFIITRIPFTLGYREKADGTFWSSKDEVWEAWNNKIGNSVEAQKYFDAVDAITPYT